METTNLVAHRLAQSIAPATQWPTETWVIRNVDMTPVAQVGLYWYAKDSQWYLWTGSIVRQETRRLGLRLQDARNESRGSATIDLP